VVVTADHGETLAETPDHAWSHGYGVDEGALRIPLIMRAHGITLGGPGVVRRQAGMASLAPTLEGLLGLPRTLGKAPDLLDLTRTGPVWDEDGWPRRPTRTVFHEATQPGHKEHTKGWNNLYFRRAVRAGGAVAARALFQASSVRMVRGAEGWLPLLTRLLRAWDAAAPAFRAANLDDATRRALQALGYLPEEQPEE
jgi:arylsulfatase A-like enzyme